MFVLLAHSTRSKTFTRNLVVLWAPIVAMIVVATLLAFLGSEQPWEAPHPKELRIQAPAFFWSLICIVFFGSAINWQIARSTQRSFPIPRYCLLSPAIILAAFLLMPFVNPASASRPLDHPTFAFVCLCAMSYLSILDVIQISTHGLQATQPINLAGEN